MKKTALALAMFSAANALDLPTPVVEPSSVPLAGRHLTGAHMSASGNTYVDDCSECGSYLYVGQAAVPKYSDSFDADGACVSRTDDMAVAQDGAPGLAYGSKGFMLSASGAGACVKDSTYYPGSHYPCFASGPFSTVVGAETTMPARIANLCFKKPTAVVDDADTTDVDETDDGKAGNVVIHGVPSAVTVIDKIVELDALMATDDIIASLTTDGFSTASGFQGLIHLVTALDLVDALNGPEPVTVFAPTDMAFKKFLGLAMNATTQELTDALDGIDAAVATHLVASHVTNGYYIAGSALSGTVDAPVSLEMVQNMFGGFDVHNSVCEHTFAETTFNQAAFNGEYNNLVNNAHYGFVMPIDHVINVLEPTGTGACVEPPFEWPECSSDCSDIPTDCDSFIANAMSCYATCSNDAMTAIVTMLYMEGTLDDECMATLQAMAGGDDDDDDEPTCTDTCTAYPTDCESTREMTMTGCASTCEEDALLAVAIMVMDAGIADQACIDGIMADKMPSSTSDYTDYDYSTSSSSSSGSSSTDSPASTAAALAAIVAVLALAL